MMDIDSREKLDLSGSWQIAFDPNNEGLRGGWTGDRWPGDRSQAIQVPGIWNIQYPDADGVGFYRTAFSVPVSWGGKPVLLHFEGAIYRCEVWIDGRFVGSHEGGYTPFWFDVTAFVQPGEESSLVVRVAALSKTKAVDGMLLTQAPLSKQSWYYVYGGIWGGVSLESCPWVACQEVRIDPDLRRERAQVELEIHNRRPECRQVDILMKVLDPRGAVAYEERSRVPVLPGAARFSYTLHLSRPLAWSCEQPQRYRLETQVIDEDGEVDRQVNVFGMRDFTVQNGQFFLNGEPLFVRGVLLQPNFPVNLINHPDREMMVREITLAKEAGFNLIRIHLQPASPGYLDLADEMGILIYAETSLAWIRESPRLLDHGRREVKALIDRDRNHPSVVFWGIYNENPPAAALNGQVLAQYARSLDPTRVIVDNSGGSLAIDQDFGWIDRASVIPAFQAHSERILDIHLYLGSPVSEAIYDWLRALGTGASSRVLVEEQIGSNAVFDEFDRESRSYPGKVFVSELGYGGMSDLDETVAGFGGREDLLDARELKILRDSLHAGFQKRNLARVFGSVQGLFREAQELQAIGNTQQLQALLSNPRVSGYVITQVNDVAWEFHAGLLDLWRNPKLSYFAAQQVNRAHVPVLRAERAVASPGDTVRVHLTLVNSGPLPGKGLLRVSVIDPQEQEVDSYTRDISFHSRIQPLDSIQVEVTACGEYQINAEVLSGDEKLAESSERITALDRVDWGRLPVEVICLGQVPGPWALECAAAEDHNAQQPAEKGARPTIYLAAHPETLSEAQWDTLFRSVESGGTAIIGALRPEDSRALQAFLRRGVDLQLHPGIGSWMGCYHWVPESDLFSGLPAGGLAKKPYAEVLPKYVLSELGGETLAGSLRNTQSRQEAPAMLWYSDIEALPFGKGALVFCQYRVFEKLEGDPVAARLAHNLLQFAS